jgi:hypothetical protein
MERNLSLLSIYSNMENMCAAASVGYFPVPTGLKTAKKHGFPGILSLTFSR